MFYWTNMSTCLGITFTTILKHSVARRSKLNPHFFRGDRVSSTQYPGVGCSQSCDRFEFPFIRVQFDVPLKYQCVINKFLLIYLTMISHFYVNSLVLQCCWAATEYKCFQIFKLTRKISKWKILNLNFCSCIGSRKIKLKYDSDPLCNKYNFHILLTMNIILGVAIFPFLDRLNKQRCT